MTVETNLTMIKLMLGDIKAGRKHNGDDKKVLRYLFGNVHNAIVHERMGIKNKDIEKPDFVYMSESFKSIWESAGKPSGSGPMSRFGIYEHYTPMNILVQRMAKECDDEDSIYKFIAEHHKLVFVTNEEDIMLNEAGYNRKLPECGGCRYDLVGIRIHPEPVLYKNFSRYKQ